MFRGVVALSLALSQQPVDEPYIRLFAALDSTYSTSDLKTLRSEIVKSQDDLIRGCKKDASRLKDQLDTDRKALQQLNKSSSNDNQATADTREQIHRRVAASDRALRTIETECEPLVNAAFEMKLGKLNVIREWPKRRQEILRRIESGRARDRKYGDIDDIGYREFFEGQEKDVAAGEQALRQMKTAGMMPEELADAAVQQYVSGLATKIATSSDLKVPVRAVVVDTPEIYGAALPGGFLFISSGLMATAESESQLAGVLAHEIARIAARHAMRASKRSTFANIFVQAAHVATGLFTGGVSNTTALYGINYGFQGLGGLVDRAVMGAKGKYQREADQLGIQYAWKAGFDPKGFIAFLDAAAREEPSKTAGFLRIQTDLDKRVVDIFSEIELLPKKTDFIVDSVEFQQIKRLLNQRVNDGAAVLPLK